MAKKLLPKGFTLGFVGAGRMAESIARGVVGSGVLPSSSILASDVCRGRRDVFRSIGTAVIGSNAEVVERSDVAVLSVKPQIVTKILKELKPFFSEDKILVSIAAGIKLKQLQELSGHERVVRVMPNTPSAVMKAASAVCLGEQSAEADGELICRIFGAVGETWRVDEKHFDAITGLSGSGPAYIYLAIEALADGGVAAGLPRDIALSLATQTVVGAATMVVSSGKHPAQLKDDVASPAGTTIAGIHELERGGFRGILMNAVVAAANRSRDLSS